ncbi:MAG TPA: L,D-transpeptidase [Chthoniobacteraceae bacterium]|nr:L,D-transpeptidase [Chthoniobacteraceae bacterium]
MRKIEVDLAAQRLDLLETDASGRTSRIASYPVSTSGFGVGSEEGSLKTPLGRFEIAERIGEGAPLGAVFKSREWTGQVAPFSDRDNPEDLVLTRILWLHGLDPDNANTRERYIYIHGTNHEETIGQPCSHGCVRMRNADMSELFGQVPQGTPVSIA